jgi:hypothetical protein
MARQRTYAPSNYSSSTAKSFSGSAATKSAQDNRSAYNREKARSTQYSSQPKTNIKNSPFTTTSTFKQSKNKVELATGKSQLDNYKVKEVPAGVPGSLILNAAQKARQKSFEINRKFYQEKVLKSKNRGGYVDTLESYSSYMENRLSGKTDAYGNVNPGYGRDRDNNIQTQKVTAGGQTILTKAKTVEETKVAEKKEEEYDKRKTKKKGRRKTMLTSAKGITKTSADYSLGKPTLLGKV